jgi:hypothetical protein
LTNAEKQKRYREKRRAMKTELKALKAAQAETGINTARLLWDS